MKKIFYSLLIVLFAMSLQALGQTKPKGKLVIIGGAQTHEIIKKFVELAGGKDARIIVIPNAGSDPKECSEEEVAEHKSYGAQSDYLLFTRETADADSNLKKMDWANAVFFTGGDQLDLTRDMLGTKLLQKVYDIYNKGGVIAGTSAGAAVMSEVMITGNELINKDTTVNFVGIQKGNVEMKQGFGFLKNVIVDQHFLKRKRHNRTISALLEHPKLFGIAIDESTSVIVNPDQTFDVFGNNQVLVYDPTSGSKVRENGHGGLGISDMKLHVLISGDKFDMKTKKTVRR
jgi:cyanophycinase